jgi:proline racemase
MCGVLVMPPVTEQADVSIVILEQGGFTAMSGANTMCAVTAILETGALPMTEPRATVRIDTAAGLVEATARVEGTKVLDVQVRNVPSWAERLDTPIEVPEYGGTGTSAWMACLHARGELGLDIPFVHESAAGTTFVGRLQEKVRLHGRDAVVPSIRGRAWITGITQVLLDPSDPFPRGFTMRDIWGETSL